MRAIFFFYLLLSIINVSNYSRVSSSIIIINFVSNLLLVFAFRRCRGHRSPTAGSTLKAQSFGSA